MKKVLLFALIAVLFTACSDYSQDYMVKVGNSLIRCTDSRHRGFIIGDSVCIYNSSGMGDEWFIENSDIFKDSTCTKQFVYNTGRKAIFTQRYRVGIIHLKLD